MAIQTDIFRLAGHVLAVSGADLVALPRHGKRIASEHCTRYMPTFRIPRFGSTEMTMGNVIVRQRPRATS